jgi:hypothetical protein
MGDFSSSAQLVLSAASLVFTALIFIITLMTRIAIADTKIELMDRLAEQARELDGRFARREHAEDLVRRLERLEGMNT